MKFNPHNLALVMLLAAPSCTGLTYSSGGVDTAGTDAHAWIAGIKALKTLDDKPRHDR